MNAQTEFKPDTETKVLKVDIMDLRKALSWVNLATDRWVRVPILGHMHFAICGNTLKITGTNLDMQASESIDCEAEGEWSFVANGRRILKITNGLSGSATIRLNASGDRLQLDLAEVSLAMNLMHAPSDWPWLTKPKEIERITVSEASLHEALQLVRHCISTEETRYYLNGIFWTHHEGKSRLVTTDGHRMARLDLDAPEPPHTAILPRDFIGPLSAMLTRKGNAAAQIIYHEVASAPIIGVELDQRTILTKTIDGKYPDYTRVIPPEEREANIDVVIPRAAAKRLCLMSDVDRWDNRACRISSEKGTMVIGSADTEATLSVAFAPPGKPGPDVEFNVKYLAQATSVLGDLRLRTSSPNEPATLTNETHTNLLMVLMPMRIR